MNERSRVVAEIKRALPPEHGKELMEQIPAGAVNGRVDLQVPSKWIELARDGYGLFVVQRVSVVLLGREPAGPLLASSSLNAAKAVVLLPGMELYRVHWLSFGG
jgi:hypothetical protein